MAASCSAGVFCKGECDLSKLYPSETTKVKLFDCNKPITSHLKRVGLKCGIRKDFSAEISSEGHLICLRMGHFVFNGNLTVCPSHREKLGIHWRQPMTCQYPQHIGKMKPFSAVNITMAESLLYEKGVLLPVGSGICKQCMKKVNIDFKKEKVPEEETTVMDDSVHVPSDCHSHMEDDAKGKYFIRERQFSSKQSTYYYCDASTDTDSQTPQQSQHSNWSETSENVLQEKNLEEINNCFSLLSDNKMSPLRSQLKTEWESVSGRTQRYYKRKADEAIDCVLELIAPGQTETIKKAEIHTSGLHCEEDMLQVISKMYLNTCNNILRSQLLSVLANRFSKHDLDKHLPNLTSYKYYQAKRLSAETSGLLLDMEQKPKIRQRMDKEKLQHAISFFLDPSFVQSVSYGTRELKLDCGEIIIIPDVVRTVCNSQMINLYRSFCEESQFEPLGNSSLYKILEVCAASKRTSLQGLDNITADGTEAFQLLEDLAKELNNENLISDNQLKMVKNKLATAKNYIKTDYKLHCHFEDACPSHCITWLLSDVRKEEFRETCEHDHHVICNKCQLLEEVEDLFTEAIISSSDVDSKIATLSQALEQIQNWKRHIIRTINQDQSRLDLLSNLEQNEVLIVMDWAMKFLPRKFREKQSDWFAQRGKNWHVTVCICKDDQGDLYHRTYTHIFNSVKQDWFTVASILENILCIIKEQLPNIEIAYLRSDNAGCYHCAPLWLSIPGISERSGIYIKNYCYSEAQSGKSYCDAKIAHMRTKMKTFVASGKDILTAEDMKSGIDYGKGVTGCQVSVATVDTSKQSITSHKMKSITSYNDITFHDGGMTVRQAYNIGRGVHISEQSLLSLSNGKEQGKTGLVMLKDFSEPQVIEGKVRNQNVHVATESTNMNRFPCPESGCLSLFHSHKDVEDHLLMGSHIMENAHKETSMDIARKRWARYCNEVVASERLTYEASDVAERDETNASNFIQGWALRTVKSRPRFSAHVKSYLDYKFKDGEESGSKATPKDVEREMKILRDKDDNKVFRPCEYLSASQIGSYFSRLGNKTPISKHEVNDEHLMIALAEIEERELFENLIRDVSLETVVQ